jgi:hypothetical protein
VEKKCDSDYTSDFEAHSETILRLKIREENQADDALYDIHVNNSSGWNDICIADVYIS